MTIRETISKFTQRPYAPVALLPDEDGKGARLFEAASGKELKLQWDELALAEEKQNSQKAAPYLLLVFHDGRQIALADVGFAFAPSTANTGPLPDLPPVLCFRDFRHLSQGVQGLLAEEGRELEALAAVMVCIALLDGARNVGLPVDREEQKLEGLLRQLEERGLPAA
jgi:hypothetical protein